MSARYVNYRDALGENENQKMQDTRDPPFLEDF